MKSPNNKRVVHDDIAVYISVLCGSVKGGDAGEFVGISSGFDKYHSHYIYQLTIPDG